LRFIYGDLYDLKILLKIIIPVNAIINGVIQIEGSPANWAESLKYPAINGPAIPAIP
jgi:hypothetical protein